MIKYVGRVFGGERMFLENNIVVRDPVCQQMVVGSKMRIYYTNADAVYVQSDADGSFVTLRKCYIF